MRIVYTNLKENDAGVKRSVRQLQVDFARSAPPSVLKASLQEEAAPPLEAGLQTYPGRTYRSTPKPVQSAPSDARSTLAEGMAALRTVFIRKFIDAQGYGGPEAAGLSITV